MPNSVIIIIGNQIDVHDPNKKYTIKPSTREILTQFPGSYPNNWKEFIPSPSNKVQTENYGNKHFYDRYVNSLM